MRAGPTAVPRRLGPPQEVEQGIVSVEEVTEHDSLTALLGWIQLAAGRTRDLKQGLARAKWLAPPVGAPAKSLAPQAGGSKPFRLQHP
ncbi:MAG TPA: hypothetical protein VNW71_20655 [Thermoanaerobaculia bacterium]|nr:hypothetical protein [Thermoanaerobaculia bacterium]